VAISYYFIRIQPSKTKGSTLNSQQTDSTHTKFRSVIIKQGRNACQAAKNHGDTPMLMNEAPALPLPACNQNCQCKFLKYDDRRREDRRTSLHVARQQIGDTEELRTKKSDRRK
jgi:hypothetical protein